MYLLELKKINSALEYFQQMDMEDTLVYCIKPGGVAADAAAVISAETATHLAGNKDDLDRSDSFASGEDLEDDKIVIDYI